MGFMNSFLALLLCLAATGTNAAEETVAAPIPVLDSRIMLLSVEAAKLSALAYEDAMQYAILDEANSSVVLGYEHPNYEEIHFYTNEPDQAIVARKGGRCYVSFRGTNLNVDDWMQNFDLGARIIHKDNITDVDEVCEARRGFTDFLWTPEVFRGAADTWACVERCADPDDCLVIAGHSQGGAEATVASTMLHSANPTVITFGQPPSVDAGCPFVPSERFYRYVNSRVEEGEDDDLGYDPVPFSPTLVSGSAHYGFFLLLGDDASASGNGVKYLGFDEDYDFFPSILDRNEVSAHTMEGPAKYSYEVRIENLFNQSDFPVSTDGFTDGSICDYDVLCASERCSSNVCTPSTKDLGCDEAGDVALPDGCTCLFDSDCSSGECETDLSSFERVCVKKDNGMETRGTPTSSGSLWAHMTVALAGNAWGIFFGVHSMV